MKNTTRIAALAVVTASVLSGCSNLPGVQPGEYPPMAPIVPQANTQRDGAIYSTQVGFSLFDDQRARAVGDILTIELVEQTQASKSATTDTSRATSIDTGTPVVLGRDVSLGGLDGLNTSVDASQSFEGSASSSQSNQLIGDITVTVAEVLANGNMVVRGEKWLTLNQGEEYIRISGIVRPSDIRPDNSVQSLRLADARITYSGKGQLANSNRGGWLTRFFSTILSPF